MPIEGEKYYTAQNSPSLCRTLPQLRSGLSHAGCADYVGGSCSVEKSLDRPAKRGSLEARETLEGKRLIAALARNA